MIRRYIERLAREAVAEAIERRIQYERESLDWMHTKVVRTSKDLEELQHRMRGHDMPWDMRIPQSTKVETEPQGYALRYPKDILQALANALLVVDENGKLRLRKPAPESKDE